MDRLWRSGIIAGVIGAVIALLGLVIIGAWFKVLTEQNIIFLAMWLSANALAFIAAGLAAGILVSPYARDEMEALEAGIIAGIIVAVVPIMFIAVMIALGSPFIQVEPSAVMLAMVFGGLFLLTLSVAQVALAGLVSTLYCVYTWKKQISKATAGDEERLGDLKALYDDLWADARTLVADMNRSILLYLFAGLFTLIYGFVILGYAAASWQYIFSGSPDLADYATAIGETVGGIAQVVVGPLLIWWYFKLKSRYAKLSALEKGDGR
ncbi:hypothetical protein MCP_2039 [Methanocella paludicola SANAE]|uniref:Uncharacterized protein n=1 Tax=Methanocella paludicola (strain DSM 17711 / JCM 13418 / NBRC 101707 / SANAE) TaxID=304371 RepID=D1Z089_METPS|nr:hypothetical protein [Methanocella paludicola]BAI62111.1 hypothetical protein MCP_2039 [Methanocella paludicola SANAE]